MAFPRSSASFRISVFSVPLGTVLAIASFVLSVTDAHAQTTIYVDAGATGNDDGSSWTDAFTELQSALNAAVSGDEVWVAQGTYLPDYDVGLATHTGDRTATFQLVNGLGIYGGFAGIESLRQQRDPVVNITILSGDLSGNDGVNFANYGENSYHVVVGSGTDASAVLDGFTITAGYANGGVAASWQGGGMYNEFGSPTVRSCIFLINATYSGTVSGGGGMSNVSSAPMLTNCAFRNNYAGGAPQAGPRGGGMRNESSSPVLINCVFEFNESVSNCGGMYNASGSSPHLINCIFRGNRAPYYAGMWNHSSSGVSTFINCVFNGNYAFSGSGGTSGGLSNGSEVILINCTFSGNVNVGNTAAGVSNGGTMTMSNCILWGNWNASGTGENAQIQAGNATITYSCIEGWTGGGTGNINFDPLFVRNPDSGPDGTWDGVNDDYGDLRLQAGSPAADAGDNNALLADNYDLDTDGNVTESIPIDLAGNTRFADDLAAADTGNPPGSQPFVDLGAYEDPQQSLIVVGSSLIVAEGSTTAFTVRLGLDPLGTAQVAVTYLTGDSDISVTCGTPLTFDSSNFSTPQNVCLTAAEDPDFIDGSTIFRVTMPGAPDILVTASEADNEPMPPTLYVDVSAALGGDGASWGTALTELQSALIIADSATGEVASIWVAQGTYLPDYDTNTQTHTADRSAIFQLLNGVSVYGGFPPGGGPWQNRDPGTYATILSGDLTGDDGPGFVNYGENSYHVVVGSGTDASAVLDGFTITAGYANGGVAASWQGGGMYNEFGSPTVRSCIFLVNATYSGTVSGGGGMSNVSSAPMLVNCVFERNRAGGSLTDGPRGGGMRNESSSPVLINCVFDSNESVVKCGGMYNTTGSSPQLINCTFRGNHAPYIGGMHNYDTTSSPKLINCVFVGNFSFSASSTTPGGLDNAGQDTALINCVFTGNYNVSNFASGVSNNDTMTMTNCILWGNWNASGTGENAQIQAGNATITYSCIEAWTGGGAGNINFDPLFVRNPDPGPDGTWDGVNDDYGDLRLQAGSPSIDAGNSDVDIDPLAPGVQPLVGVDAPLNANGTVNIRRVDDPATVDTGIGTFPIVDMGAYEFGSTLIGSPLYVNASVAGEKTGVNWVAAFDDLQTALLTALASNGNVSELWTAGGIYRPAEANGDRYASFGLIPGLGIYGGFAGGESQRSQRDPGTNMTVLSGDLNGNDGPNYANNGENAYHVVKGSGADVTAVLDGFTITGGNADGISPFDVGAGIYLGGGKPTLNNCVFAGNMAATEGGGIYSYLGRMQTVDVTIGENVSVLGNGAVISKSWPYLQGTLALTDGTPGSPVILDVRSSTFEGPGILNLGTDTALYISDAPFLDPVVIRSNVGGTGNIDIAPGQQLVIEGNAVVELNDGMGGQGTITIEGELIVRGQAALQNTRIDVLLADIKDGGDIQFNDIFLLDTAGFGGQFYVEGSATVANNTIVSEGDRYLDLDPDVANPNLNITGNTITVLIKEGTTVAQGTLLELRAFDHDCTPPCASGAIELASSIGYSDTWTLEELRVEEDAKVNLTNRQGFDFNGPTSPDAVYVKQVTLYPNAILNLAGQRLYYQTLLIVDSMGSTLDTNPVDPYGPHVNGSTVTDAPLLGFSLGIIAMNDATASPFNEFDIRMRKRLTDPDDPEPLPQGTVSLVPDVRAIGDGVMEMKTNGASSVAAKGQFARAGEDEIFIAFEYKFIQADANTELVIKLSDDRNPGDGSGTEPNNVIVATLKPPDPGRAGAVGSTEFGIFTGTFPRGSLNFLRHTWVELELRGANSIVQIDNLDPQIICSLVCADFDPQNRPGVDESDYLLLLAEAGQTVPNADKFCVDLTGDGYVDLQDMLIWDAFFTEVLNLCTPPPAPPSPSSPQALPPAPSVPASDGLILAGKARDPDPINGRVDAVYQLDTGGLCQGIGVSPPAGGLDSLGNGRLIKDAGGVVYQLHGTLGLYRLNDLNNHGDNELMIIPNQVLNFDTDADGTADADIDVGITSTNGSIPLADVVFHPTLPNTVYVTPVRVTPQSGGNPYEASARLLLADDGTGNFTLERVYGVADASGSDLQKAYPREIEVGTNGNFLFVISARAASLAGNVQLNNDWLLIFDQSASGAELLSVALHNLATPINDPTALTVSCSDKLYLSTSLSTAAMLPTLPRSKVFRFSIMRDGSSKVTAVNFDDFVEVELPVTAVDDQGLGFLATITTIEANTANDQLRVIGYSSPKFAPNAPLSDPVFLETAPILATPSWTSFSTSATALQSASAITCHNLALPASAVFISSGPVCCNAPKADLDGDGDVDPNDFLTFSNCFNGALNPPTAGCLTPCADVDGDGDVDPNDFLTFSNCFNGALNPPNCP